MKQLILFALILPLLASCGPKGAGSGSSGSVYPYDLRVEVDRHELTVAWRKHGSGAISGYQVYINESPLVEKFPGRELPPTVTPFNPSPFPGDTNPEDGIEYFTAEGLDNGKKYYVSVRVIFPDLSLSKPSREVLSVCGSRGEVDLGLRYTTETDGYSFDQDKFVRADDALNDLYFFASKGEDYLASPTRLDKYLRKTRLVVLPYHGSWQDVKNKFSIDHASAAEERVAIHVGDWIHAVTADGHNALINVRSLSGEGKNRSARLFFALSTLSGEAVF